MPNWNRDQDGPEWLQPEWPAPAAVRAAATTRIGGVSAAPFHSLNLAGHVGDDERAVSENRSGLVQTLGLPAEPRWLNQVHGCDVAAIPSCDSFDADAAWSDRPGDVCVVMTADCLPLLMCNSAGTGVAAVHAGWRGLCDGVIEAALSRFSVPSGDLMAWLGPAIGPRAFEVGGEVREAFVRRDKEAEEAFVAGEQGKWLADLFALARMRLRKAGVEAVYGGGLCTYSDEERFFSYRRDGVTGRMASLIWIEEERDDE